MVFQTFDWYLSAQFCQYGWKEPLNVSKVAMFESDLSKTNEDIAP